MCRIVRDFFKLTLGSSAPLKSNGWPFFEKFKLEIIHLICFIYYLQFWFLINKVLFNRESLSLLEIWYLIIFNGFDKYHYSAASLWLILDNRGFLLGSHVSVFGFFSSSNSCIAVCLKVLFKKWSQDRSKTKLKRGNFN